jgi:Leucine-rich repeat (LRR) protein
MENDDDQDRNASSDKRRSAADGGTESANVATEAADLARGRAPVAGAAHDDSEGRFEGETEEEVDASLREALLAALQESEKGRRNPESGMERSSSHRGRRQGDSDPDALEELRDIKWTTQVGMFRNMWIEKRYDSKDGKWKARVKRDSNVSSASLRPLLGRSGDDDEDDDDTDTAAESSDGGGESSAEELIKEVARLRRKLRSQQTSTKPSGDADQDDVEIGAVPDEQPDLRAHARRPGAFRVRGTGDDGEIGDDADDDDLSVEAVPRPYQPSTVVMQNFDAIMLEADLVVEHEAVQAIIVRRKRQIIAIGGLVLLSAVIVAVPLALKAFVPPPYPKPDYAFVSMASLQSVFNKSVPNATLEAINRGSTPQFEAYRWLFASGVHPDLPVTEAEPRMKHRFSLATLFYSTGGSDSWRTHTGWLDHMMHECYWYGVVCANGTAGALGSCEKTFGIPSVSCSMHVATMIEGLELPGNGIKLSLPSEIGLLRTSNISRIRLDNNNLGSVIPSEIKELTSLRILSLIRNRLDGTIQSTIGDLNSLESLDLRQNKLTGAIPVSLANLGKLKDLDLSGNGLSRSIPTHFGLMTSLVTAVLSQNALTGLIPSEISALESLTILDLSHNSLTINFPDGKAMTSLQVLALGGNDARTTIPTHIGEFASLVRLDVSSCGLAGSIPSELGQLEKLSYVDCSGNSLTGTIPTELGNLRRLIVWNTEGNQYMTGSLPSELAKLTALEEFLAASNSHNGTFPTELGNASALRVWDTTWNKLTGRIPSELGRLSTLERFSVSCTYNSDFQQVLSMLRSHSHFFAEPDNLHAGSIPAEFALLTNLSSLDLGHCRLSGAIPNGFGQLVKLESLLLFGNMLSGTIPTELGLLTNARTFDASGNLLIGRIPQEIGNLAELTDLSLGINILTQTIPTKLGCLTALKSLSLFDNFLVGQIPTEILKLKSLVYLELGGNTLDGGEIFSELLALTNLQVLNVSNAGLSGTIATELGTLAGLRYISLDRNRLVGTIPTELGFLTKLKTLQISNTNVSGTIPTELEHLTELDELSLNANSLNGTIPAEIGLLWRRLTKLGLFDNCLTGSIPSELAGLVWLEVLRLETNMLSGSVPSELCDMMARNGGEVCISIKSVRNCVNPVAPLQLTIDCDRVQCNCHSNCTCPI